MAWRFYRGLLTKYPLGTQMVTTGLLCGGGDVISQLAVERKTWQNYQVDRTVRFFGVGLLWIGPVLRGWFIQLEKVTSGGPKFAPLLRMVIDQALFGPCLLSTVLILLRYLEGNSLSKSVVKWKEDFPVIFVTGLTIWPAVQLCNFYLVPLEHRVLVVQTVALGWNTYLAYIVSRTVPPSAVTITRPELEDVPEKST